MHSLTHVDLARTLAADRLRDVQRVQAQSRSHRAPPRARRWAAHATARLAARLDAESARRAVA